MYVVIFDEVYYMCYSMGSGKYLTALRNSLYNLFALIFVWYDLHEWNPKTPFFFKHMRPATYGDDGAVGCDKYAQQIFANETSNYDSF